VGLGLTDSQEARCSPFADFAVGDETTEQLCTNNRQLSLAQIDSHDYH
jgi:hypothetical protein